MHSYSDGSVGSGPMAAKEEFGSDYHNFTEQVQLMSQKVNGMQSTLYRKVVSISGDFPVGVDEPVSVRSLSEGNISPPPLATRHRIALADLSRQLDLLAQTIQQATQI